jgi:hypothetical protein
MIVNSSLNFNDDLEHIEYTLAVQADNFTFVGNLSENAAYSFRISVPGDCFYNILMTGTFVSHIYSKYCK